jgi:hypothetical protein
MISILLNVLLTLYANGVHLSRNPRKTPGRQQFASQPLALPTGKPPVSGQTITGNTSPLAKQVSVWRALALAPK